LLLDETNYKVVINLIQNEQRRLGSMLRIRLGIFAAMKRIEDYQEGLFEAILIPSSEQFAYKNRVPFKTKSHLICESTELDDTLDELIASIDNKVDKYTEDGSGWSFHAVEEVFLEIMQVIPITAHGYIPLPSSMTKKNNVTGVIIINRDNFSNTTEISRNC